VTSTALPQGRRLFYLSVLLFCGLSWGSTQTMGKIAVSTGHQFLGLIFWQMVIGVLLLGALLLINRKPLPINRQTLTFAVIVALIGTIIPNSTFYYSITHLPAGIMSILISTVPLISFPIALLLGMDRFSAARIAGLLCGLAGVALIALPSASLPDPAMAAFLPIALIGPLCYAIESNYVARTGTVGMDAMQAMFLTSLVGAIISLPLALGSGQFINPIRPWTSAEYALVGSSCVHAMAYTSYVWLASRAGAVFASQSSYIVTGTGVLWAMILLGETYSTFVWAALVLMLLGLALVQPRETARLPAKEPA
jgi:drug/metabolite transporter (DMT)-like permease